MVTVGRYNRAFAMHAVDIEVQPGDLSHQMSAMRIWLDENRFKSSTFSCRDVGYAVHVSVEFRVARQAAAFARRFRGLARGSVANAEATGLSPRHMVG